MQIKEVRVNWHERYANSPTFEVYIDAYGTAEPFRYRKHPVHGLYYAQDDATGLVRFFAYDVPGDGYGGSVFDIVLEDGKQVSLKGPWSSRSGVMNKHFDDVECLDVTLKSNPTPCEWLEGGIGYSNLAGGLTLTKLLEWMVAHRDSIDFWVTKVTRDGGEYYYEPCHKDGSRKGKSSFRDETSELVIA